MYIWISLANSFWSFLSQEPRPSSTRPSLMSANQTRSGQCPRVRRRPRLTASSSPCPRHRYYSWRGQFRISLVRSSFLFIRPLYTEFILRLGFLFIRFLLYSIYFRKHKCVWIISQSWNDAINWNPLLWKSKTCLSYLVSTQCHNCIDQLAAQDTRESAAIVST